jgi:hypothetical protein
MTTMYRKLLVGLAIMIGFANAGSAANAVINISSIQSCARIGQISKIPSICCAETGIVCAGIDAK